MSLTTDPLILHVAPVYVTQRARVKKNVLDLSRRPHIKYREKSPSKLDSADIQTIRDMVQLVILFNTTRVHPKIAA